MRGFRRLRRVRIASTSVNSRRWCSEREIRIPTTYHITYTGTDLPPDQPDSIGFGTLRPKEHPSDRWSPIERHPRTPCRNRSNGGVVPPGGPSCRSVRRPAARLAGREAALSTARRRSRYCRQLAYGTRSEHAAGRVRSSLLHRSRSPQLLVPEPERGDRSRTNARFAYRVRRRPTIDESVTRCFHHHHSFAHPGRTDLISK